VEGGPIAATDLFVEAFVDEALGNSAYLVGSHASRQAVLIDPLRDVDRYLSAADRLSVRVTHVLDTHLHADFLSGARELAAQAGTQIAASAAARLAFDHLPLAEGDTIDLGGGLLRVMATPGHAPEHISFLLAANDQPAPMGLFSGGALIVGGAARTDLLGHDLCVPLARQLYHTMHHKLLALPDEVNVYPTHGSGSFCAAGGSAAGTRVTTIGKERQGNRLAWASDEDEFVELALAGLPSYPTYYKEMRPINQRGPRVLGGVPVLRPMEVQAVLDALRQGARLLDVRPRQDFARGHVPAAYGIERAAPLGAWAGWLLPFGSRLVLMAEEAAALDDAVRQLIRIGYEDLLGYLEGGLEAWASAGLPVASVPRLSVGKLRERLRSRDGLALLDVRQDSEWEAGHISGAVHIENGRMVNAPLPWPDDQPIAIYCAVGARSMAGISVLLRRGFTHLYLVDGGFNAWHEAGYEVHSESWDSAIQAGGSHGPRRERRA
jgi:hydroxyacylglutathione hydrolase